MAHVPGVQYSAIYHVVNREAIGLSFKAARLPPQQRHCTSATETTTRQTRRILPGILRIGGLSGVFSVSVDITSPPAARHNLPRSFQLGWSTPTRNLPLPRRNLNLGNLWSLEVTFGNL